MNTTAAGVSPAPSGPSRRGRRPQRKSYLLKAPYRQIVLADVFALGDAGAFEYFTKARWTAAGEGKQACPGCGVIAAHYRYSGRWFWKCRETSCGEQFTMFSGTRLHSTKMPPATLLSILHHYVEAKDSISAREISGLHGIHYQSARCLLMKIREAIRETMQAEPKLTGNIQADAAYFLRYIRPGNIGTGRALAAKGEQRNAGLDENAKQKQSAHSKRMHAIVVFVQTGEQGDRRYKIAKIKTENQADVERLAGEFCEKYSLMVTDTHSSYFTLSKDFEHQAVNHGREFKSKDGIHTNLAENFFSRIRAAQAGAWHRLTIQYLEEYAWEFAWRQTMLGRSNQMQLEDLLRRLLSSGRSTRFGNCWNKRPRVVEDPEAEDTGYVVEVPKSKVPKRRGRPVKGVIRAKAPKPIKRAYRRKAALSENASPVDSTPPIATGEAPALPAPSIPKAGE
jgi:hypothetical protein